MGFRVEIKEQSCLGSGSCALEYPSAFALDDRRIARVLPGAAELSDDDLLEAARCCPASAITLFDAQGGEVDIFG